LDHSDQTSLLSILPLNNHFLALEYETFLPTFLSLSTHYNFDPIYLCDKLEVANSLNGKLRIHFPPLKYIWQSKLH
jgi:hypothetical protein